MLIQQIISGHYLRTEFTLHWVLWAVKLVMCLHAECSLNQVAFTELAWLEFAFLVFMRLNVQEAKGTTLRAPLAHNLRCLVHADELLLRQAFVEIRMFRFTVRTLIAALGPV